MTAGTWLAVAFVGGCGAMARFAADGAVAVRTGRRWPYGTMAVNLTGTFALGVLVGAAVDGSAYTVAGTALLGSYTTFSTWLYETQRLVEEGSFRAAAANVVVGAAAGLGAAALGRVIGGWL